MTTLVIGGSRRIDAATVAMVTEATLTALDSGASITVGCAVGADAAVLAAVPPALRHRVHCFAVFGKPTHLPDVYPGGWFAHGAWVGSAVSAVAEHAAAGGPVTWWAGGAPGVPIVARLKNRTMAAAAAADAGCYLFFGNRSSAGTTLCGRLIAARGLVVRAWPVGFPGVWLPALGAGGWRPLNGAGLWAGAWAWLPAYRGALLAR